MSTAEGPAPAETIDALVAARRDQTDAQVLAEIAAGAPLPDEDDPFWQDPINWQAAYRYVALADVAALRRLRSAVRLLLERASFGDPGEMMRGLRHAFEAIYTPDWTALADEYLALARAERLGTRLWAIDSLLVLDDRRAVPVFEASVREDPKDIRWRAEVGLQRILHPEVIAREAAQRRAEDERARQEWLDREAGVDAGITDLRCPACGKPMPDYRRTCKHCGAFRGIVR